MEFSRLELAGAAKTELAARRRDAAMNFILLVEFSNEISEIYLRMVFELCWMIPQNCEGTLFYGLGGQPLLSFLGIQYLKCFNHSDTNQVDNHV